MRLEKILRTVLHDVHELQHVEDTMEAPADIIWASPK